MPVDRPDLKYANGGTDTVNSPPHYCISVRHKLGNAQIECLDVIEALGLDRDLYLGSAFQYIWRAGKKWDKIEDLKKAVFYINKAIAKEEEERLNEIPF